MKTSMSKVALALGVGSVLAAEVAQAGVQDVLPTAYVQKVENKTLTSCRGMASGSSDDVYLLSDIEAWPDKSTKTLEATYRFDAFDQDPEMQRIYRIFLDNLGELFGDSRKLTREAFNTEKFEALLGDAEIDDKSLTRTKFDDWLELFFTYGTWNADFVVTFDDDIEPGSFVLAGLYDYKSAWAAEAFEWQGNPWVGDSQRNATLEKGVPFRLLKDNGYKSVFINYSEICTKVQTFFCGAVNLSPDNYGKTINVELRLFKNNGGSADDGQEYLSITNQQYTFLGPLSIEYYTNGVTEAAFTTDFLHDGKHEIVLWKGDFGADTALVGWAKDNDDSIVFTNSMPACWTDGEPIKLYARTRDARTVEIPPQSEATPVPIKVTKEWLEQVGIGSESSAEKISEELQKTNSAAGAKLPLWQTYVLGLNPSGKVEVVETESKQGDEGHSLVVSTVKAPAPDSGFKVTYLLDKLPDESGEAGRKVDERPTNDLQIDLEPEDYLPTGYYKMSMVVTPEGEEIDSKEAVVVEADSTIGVLKVENHDKQTMISVPWQSLAEKGEDIHISEIIKTSSLNENDRVSVFEDDSASGMRVYKEWQYQGNDTWKPIKSSYFDDQGVEHEIDPGSATEFTVKCGSGLWLERTDPKKPFYLLGLYDQDRTTSINVKKGSEGVNNQEFTMIAPPGITETDLNTNESLTSDAVNEKDQLMLVRDGVPTYFTFSKTSNKWGYSKKITDTLPSGRKVTKFVREEGDAKVPAGIGLWYISAGGEPTIQW